KAHEPEQGHGQDDRVADGAKGEPDGEVVQAEGGAADQQPPAVPGLRAPAVVVAAAQGLDESPDCGREQDPGAGPAGSGSQRAGQAGADEHPGGRHHDVAQAEDRGHLQLGPPVHAADPDGDRGPEVVQPERDRHDQQSHHDWATYARPPASINGSRQTVKGFVILLGPGQQLDALLASGSARRLPSAAAAGGCRECPPPGGWLTGLSRNYFAESVAGYAGMRYRLSRYYHARRNLGSDLRRNGLVRNPPSAVSKTTYPAWS